VSETTLKRGKWSSLAQTVSRFVAGIVAYKSNLLSKERTGNKTTL